MWQYFLVNNFLNNSLFWIPRRPHLLSNCVNHGKWASDLPRLKFTTLIINMSACWCVHTQTPMQTTTTTIASHKFIHTQVWSFAFYAKSLALLKLFYLGELWSGGLCSNVGGGGGGGGGSAVPYSYIPRAAARAQIRGWKKLTRFAMLPLPFQ